jgi:hypothetical protein
MFKETQNRLTGQDILKKKEPALQAGSSLFNS